MKCKIEYCKSLLTKVTWLPPLLARITVGVVFIESGWGKLHNLERVIGYFSELGIPFPTIQAPMVAAIEFGAGIFLLIGITTRLVTAPLIAIMAVAIVTAKAADITTVTDIFAISEFLYIILLLWLAVNGPGKISLDHYIFKKWRP